MTLAPNATLPCPSDSHRRTMLAHGRICVTCEPRAEQPVRCPVCKTTVVAAGKYIRAHNIWSNARCMGSGMVAEFPPVTIKPIWAPDLRNRRQRAIALADAGVAR